MGRKRSSEPGSVFSFYGQPAGLWLPSHKPRACVWDRAEIAGLWGGWASPENLQASFRGGTAGARHLVGNLTRRLACPRPAPRVGEGGEGGVCRGACEVRGTPGLWAERPWPASPGPADLCSRTVSFPSLTYCGPGLVLEMLCFFGVSSWGNATRLSPGSAESLQLRSLVGSQAAAKLVVLHSILGKYPS